MAESPETLFRIDNPLGDELAAVRGEIACRPLIDTVLMGATCLAVTIATCRGDVDPGSEELAASISLGNIDDDQWLDLDLDRFYGADAPETATPEEVDALTDAAHQMAWHAYYIVRNTNLLARLQQAA